MMRDPMRGEEELITLKQRTMCSGDGDGRLGTGGGGTRNTFIPEGSISCGLYSEDEGLCQQKYKTNQQSKPGRGQSPAYLGMRA